jgi:proline iminopeptidase
MNALLSNDKQQQTNIAYALYDWQSMIGRLTPVDNQPTLDEEQLIAHFQIQLHFALQQCFIEQHAILDNIGTLHPIPAWLIQGRYDLVCPVKQSLELHQAWPNSQLNLIHLAGHAGDEPAVIDALINATNTVAQRLSNLVNNDSA